jgi:hypothetical protein
VRAFLGRVPDRVRVSLVVFASEPFVVTPPTTDHDLVRLAVDSLGSYPVRGTAIGDALAAAVELAERAVGTGPPPAEGEGTTIAFRTAAAAETEAETPAPSSPASILFLSDGSQTRGYLTPEEGADRAKAAGIPSTRSPSEPRTASSRAASAASSRRSPSRRTRRRFARSRTRRAARSSRRRVRKRSPRPTSRSARASPGSPGRSRSPRGSSRSRAPCCSVRGRWRCSGRRGCPERAGSVPIAPRSRMNAGHRPGGTLSPTV